MRIETDNRDAATALRRTAELIEKHGGTVSPDFIVRESAGVFHCAVRGSAGQPGRQLVTYDRSLRPPMDHIKWRDVGGSLPDTADLDGLSGVHRALAEEWLALMDCTDKVTQVRSGLPWLAVTDQAIREHVASAGFSEMAALPPPAGARRALVAIHCGSHPAGGLRLVPLKCLVNHDIDGADQSAVPGVVSVVTSATSDEQGTYEYYGDLDAMQLAIWHGYLDAGASFVHALPCTIEARGTRVTVTANNGGYRDPQPPSFSPTDHGLAVSRLTFRRHNWGRLQVFMSLALAGRFGLSESSSHLAANAVLTDIWATTCMFYERLAVLVEQSPGLQPVQHHLLHGVATLQRERLDSVGPSWE